MNNWQKRCESLQNYQEETRESRRRRRSLIIWNSCWLKCEKGSEKKERVIFRNASAPYCRRWRCVRPRTLQTGKWPVCRESSSVKITGSSFVVREFWKKREKWVKWVSCVTLWGGAKLIILSCKTSWSLVGQQCEQRTSFDLEHPVLEEVGKLMLWFVAVRWS